MNSLRHCTILMRMSSSTKFIVYSHATEFNFLNIFNDPIVCFRILFILQTRKMKYIYRTTIINNMIDVIHSVEIKLAQPYNNKTYFRQGDAH